MENLVTSEILAQVEDYDQFHRLSQSLQGFDQQMLFKLVFPIALQRELFPSSRVAAMLLLEFDPKPTSSLGELLLAIHRSNWDVSDKFVPFYLVTQFGKSTVLSEISNLQSANRFDTNQNSRIDGIKYWASMPAASLSADFTYFEWQEAIEGKAV